MKTRKNFISNSSSSSFIILGIETDFDNIVSNLKKQDLSSISEKYTKYLDDEDDLTYGVEKCLEYFGLGFISDNDASRSIILGKIIAEGIEESRGGEINLSELMKDLKPKLSEYGSEKPIKLFYGNKSC